MLVVEEKLFTTLSGGTALTALLGGTEIYNALGNRGSVNTYPMVIFTKSSGVDDNDSPHRAKTLVYQVTGISMVSKYQAETIDNACDALIHNASLGSMVGWGDYWCRRETDISYVEEIAGGKVLWHEGGMYRIRLAV